MTELDGVYLKEIVEHGLREFPNECCGLIGGILCTLVLSKFGRGHAAYSRVGLWGIAGVLGVGLLSIAVAYWRVRGYA